MNEDIIEDNILIAKFMGWDFDSDFGMFHNPFLLQQFNCDALLFHSDWNWLIPVLAKIYETPIYYSEYIEYNGWAFTTGEIEFSTKIDEIYGRVSDFVTWWHYR